MSVMKTKPLHCGNCGKALTGRQQRWCSPACGVAGWQRANPTRHAERVRRWRRGEHRPLKPLEERIIALEVELAVTKAALAKGPVE